MPRQRTRTPEVADGIAAAALEIVRAEGADGLTTRRAAAAAGNVHIRDLVVESLESVEEDLGHDR